MAHGNVSFVDSARDTTLSDLSAYKTDIIDYLIQLNESVTDFIETKNYKFYTT